MMLTVRNANIPHIRGKISVNSARAENSGGIKKQAIHFKGNTMIIDHAVPLLRGNSEMHPEFTSEGVQV